LQSNLLMLLAAKQQREGKRVSLRRVAQELKLNEYTVYGFANNSLREYPAEAIVKLCGYFECGVGDLLTIVDVPEASE